MESKIKLLIVAAEPSGDLLGHEIISSLNKKKEDFEFCGIGGDKMASLGFQSLINIKLLSINGIFEVLAKIFSLIYILRKTELHIRKIKPDIILTIDAPSFNYRLIKRVKDLRNKTMFVHCVAPTVWAWKEKRAKQFGNIYDLLLTLFKFEPKFFHPYNLNTFCIGHPIFFKEKKKDSEIVKKKLITIFPGSRVNEIKYNLPKILKSIFLFNQNYDGYKFKILSISLVKNEIEKILKKYNSSLEVIYDTKKKNDLLAKSFMSIASSGTVVLEIAESNIPMIVVYDSNFFTSLLVKKMVKVKWANIVNIIFDASIVPELLFEKFTPKNVFLEMKKLVENKKEVNKQLYAFNKIKKELIIRNKRPSDIAAEHIIRMYKKIKSY